MESKPSLRSAKKINEASYEKHAVVYLQQFAIYFEYNKKIHEKQYSIISELCIKVMLYALVMLLELSALFNNEFKK